MKKNLLLCAIICIAHCTAFTQATHNIDSLKKSYFANRQDYHLACYLAQSYEFQNEDSAKHYATIFRNAITADNHRLMARYFNIYGNLFLVKNNLDSAIAYYKLALVEIKQSDDHFDVGTHTYNLAQALMTKGDVTASILQYNDAINIYKAGKDSKYKDDKLAMAYSGLGDAYGLVGLYDIALKQLYQGLALQKKNNALMDVGLTLNSIGAIQDNMGEYNQSNQSNFEALAIFNQVEYPLAKGTICLNIGKVLLKQNKLDSALLFAKLAEKIIVDAKTTYNLGSVYNLFAEIEMKKNNCNSAIAFYTKSLDVNKAEPGQPIYGQTLVGYAEALAKQGDKQLAYQQFRTALQLFSKENLLKDKKECLQKMATYFLEIKNVDSANAYYSQFLIASDSFLNAEKQNSIVAQQIKFETSLKEATIAQQQSDIKAKQQQNILLSIGLGLLAAIVLGLIWLYRKIKIKNKIILNQKQEILHNNKNNLNQIISIFQRQSRIEGNDKNALDNQERLFTLNLLNKMLYENEGATTVNVNEYLPQLCNAKKISTGNKVDIIVSASNIQLEMNLLKDIGLIVNELSMNAIKHAFANTSNPTINITVTQENDKINLIVKDNGAGIDENVSAKVGDGFGMQFVKDLVEQHHGKMIVINNNGTEINIELKK
jgi:two-component system, sensor histidine kinase PdtaS